LSQFVDLPKSNGGTSGQTGGTASTVKVTDGSTTATITNVAGKQSLDVNVTDLSINHSADSIKIGDGTNTITSSAVDGKRALDVNAMVNEESIQLDEPDSVTTYVGYAPLGTSASASAWKIKRILVTSTQTSVSYANGSAGYGNVWANRSSLSYS
jgi:hypothetical protein